MTKASKVFDAGGRTVASMRNRSPARPRGRRVFLLSSRAYSGRTAFNDRGDLVEGRFLGSCERALHAAELRRGRGTPPPRLWPAPSAFGVILQQPQAGNKRPSTHHPSPFRCPKLKLLSGPPFFLF